MNLGKLKEAEAKFFEHYPGGFQNSELVAISKKHKMDQMIRLAQEGFGREQFKQPEAIVETMVKMVSRSSMVSVFEKPRFKEFVISLPLEIREMLAQGLELSFYGQQPEGFELLLDILKTGKLAKWSLITVWPAYFRPRVEVFVKPTTVKGVIDFFEIQSLLYKPTPTWSFYQEYREVINEMKTVVDPSLSPSNAAFSGFLMLSMANG